MGTMTVAAFLVIAALAGSGIVFAAFRNNRKWRADLRDLASREGWRVEETAASGQDGMRIDISDPARGWTLTLYSLGHSTSGGRSGTTRWTRFTAPDLALGDGLAVLGPDMPEGARIRLESALGSTGGIGHMILTKLLGALGPDMSRLQAVPDEGAGTLLATPGAETALMPIRDAPDLASARRGRNPAQQPVAIRDGQGFALRHSGLMRKPDDLRAFAALGHSLAERLRAAA